MQQNTTSIALFVFQMNANTIQILTLFADDISIVMSFYDAKKQISKSFPPCFFQRGSNCEESI